MNIKPSCMRILFVVSDLFFSEPLGVMLLSSIVRQSGHQTRLVALKRHILSKVLQEFDPDIVAYSTMTSDEHLFIRADELVKDYQKIRGRKIFRIMGGPHATFFQEVLVSMGLDAICIGEGDLLLPRLIKALETGSSLEGIPNLLLLGQTECVKELPDDLDSFPFADRDLLYQADPELQHHGIRSVLTQRGCPYRCTYCFNHAYTLMFRGPGRKLFRRRSVDNLLTELLEVKKRYPTVRQVRFADDVFVIRHDAWLEEFAERYPREIGIPFYCLIRCNTMSDDTARLLSQAGCCSVSMSIETGTEEIRNKILHRHMSDQMIQDAFSVARKYRIHAFANTILALPGTTLADDLQSFSFARKLKPACPTFSIFAPYPKTNLTDYAVSLGLLDQNFDFKKVSAADESLLSNYTQEEKKQQVNLMYLGQIFCFLPDICLKILPLMIRLPLTSVYRLLFSISWTWFISTKIFPGAYPRSPIMISKAILRGIKYAIMPNEEGKIKE